MKLLRHLSVSTAMLLLSVCCTYAQNNNGGGTAESGTQEPSAVQQSGSPTGEVGHPNGVNSRDNGSLKSSTKVEVEGCLNGSNGNYALIDKGGQLWRLRGDAADLSKAAGHQVKVSGKLLSGSAVSAAGPTSNATGGATGTAMKKGVPANGTVQAGNETTGDVTRRDIASNNGVLEVHKIKTTGAACSAGLPH